MGAPTTTPVPVPSVVPQDLNAIIDHLVRDAPFRRSMVHEVLKDLDRTNSVTIEMVREKLRTLSLPSPGASTAEITGVSTCVGTLKHKMFKHDELMALLRKRAFFLTRDGPAMQ